MPAPRKPRKRLSAPDELIVNVAGLLGDPPGTRRDYAVTAARIRLGPDISQVEPISGSFRLDRTNRGLLLDGAFRTSIAAICSRCLRDIAVPLDLIVEEEVLPSLDVATGVPLDPDDAPDVVRLTDHHELELEPLLREAVQLAEPIAPLCRPDCPGLCIECGLELATGRHEHAEEPIDPRLAALAGFRVDVSPETD